MIGLLGHIIFLRIIDALELIIVGLQGLKEPLGC